jgi:hypothetical protein
MNTLDTKLTDEMFDREVKIANAMLYWAKDGYKTREIPLNYLKGFNKVILSHSAIIYKKKTIFALIHYSPDSTQGYGVEGNGAYKFTNLFQLYNHLQKLIPKWDEYIDS